MDKEIVINVDVISEEQLKQAIELFRKIEREYQFDGTLNVKLIDFSMTPEY